MAVRVSLQDIIDAMDSQSEEVRAYLNRTTGKIIGVTTEALHAAETGTHDDFYEAEILEEARAVLAEEEDYICLPDRYMIHEYQIMERFALSLDDPEICDQVLSAMRGRGAFRRFKDTLIDLELIQDWYDYRAREFKEIAIDWCKDHNIEYDPE